MGVVARQSIKHSILKVIGVFVGMISMLYVYPLNHDTYGYLQFLVGTATLLVPLTGLGFSQSLIKFYPEYQEFSGSDTSFIVVGLLINLSTFVGFLILFFLIKEPIFNFFEGIGRPLTKIRESQYSIVAIAGALMICMSTINFISNFKRIVIPSMLYDLGYKFFLPTIVLLTSVGILAKHDLGAIVCLFYFIVFVALLVYIRILSKQSLMPRFNFFTKERRNKIITYSLFSAASSIGAVLAFRIDAIMITEMLNETQTGLYFNLFVIAMIIDIPNKALMKISAPIISKHWLKSETEKINELYKKGSINALIIGLLIYIGIGLNLEELLQLSSNPTAFVGSIGIFGILGLAKLIDAATGINNQIIIYSNLYIYNFIFIIFLAVCNIVFNIIFIGKYGLVGAAMATFISLTLFNVLKYIFIAIKFKMVAFSVTTLQVFAIGLVSVLIVMLLPKINNLILSIIIKSSIIFSIYTGLIYKLKLSGDINNIINRYVRKII